MLTGCSQRSLLCLLAATLLSLAALISAACGEDTYGPEGPPVTTSSGDGGSGLSPPTSSSGSGAYGAYGGEGGAGGTGGTGPTCADEDKWCPHIFSLPDSGYSTVEVRGSWEGQASWDAGESMTLSGGTWSAEVYLPWDTNVQYKFVVDGSSWITDPGNPNQVDDGFGGFNSLLDGITCEDGEWECRPTTTLGDFDWRDGVLYFVFVDRFLDGDPSNNGSPVSGVLPPANYQGGDWAGVIEKINDNYFTDLGVNALWLSVPMNNTDDAGLGTDGRLYSAYHAYWPTDLDATEARFGTLAELQALVDAAHAKDIMVILDYAMNHVHISSPIYAQHPDWFWDIYDGSTYCVCGEGCGWNGYQGRRCWFRDYLPDFNFTNQAARDFSVNNAIQWALDTGADGFRLDAVKHIEDQWILDLRSRVKTDIESVTQQHFYMVGETYTGDKGTIGYYVNPSTMLDGQFDFPLRAALVSALLIRNSDMNALESFLAGNDGYYGNGIMSTFIGNHDVPRTIHFAQDSPIWQDAWAGGQEIAWDNPPGLPAGMSAFERVANSYTVLMTLPGVPLIYYGDEVGMAGAGDPDNRRFMQWSGYSSGQTFLKNHITALTAIRAAHPALRRGNRTTVSVTTDTLAYRMSGGGDDVYVAINRGDSQQTVSGLPSGSYIDELDGSSHSGPNITVPARSGRVLTPQ